MSRWVVAAGQFVVLFAFWVALSGQLNLLFLAMGAGSAALATAVTSGMVADCLWEGRPRVNVFRRAWWFAVYVAWLVTRIIVASVQLAYFIIHPSASLEPGVLRFRSGLSSPIARVILANSITLVPGTLTVRLDEGEYTVHVLVPGAAEELIDATMQNMIGRVFGEPRELPPDVTWEQPGEAVR